MEKPRRSSSRVPRQPAGTTVFAASQPASRRERRRASAAPRTPIRTPRSARASTTPAPWLDNMNGPTNTGMIVRTAQLPGRGARAPSGPQVHRRMSTSSSRSRRGSWRRRAIASSSTPTGEVVGDSNRVMQPTAIVTVIASPMRGGSRPRADHRSMFGGVIIGQKLIPLEKFTMNPDARPAPLLLGTEGQDPLHPATGDGRDQAGLRHPECRSQGRREVGRSVHGL